jgi:hypothetical protein
MHRLHDSLGPRFQLIQAESACAAERAIDSERPLRRVDAGTIPR